MAVACHPGQGLHAWAVGLLHRATGKCLFDTLGGADTLRRAPSSHCQHRHSSTHAWSRHGSPWQASCRPHSIRRKTPARGFEGLRWVNMHDAHLAARVSMHLCTSTCMHYLPPVCSQLLALPFDNGSVSIHYRHSEAAMLFPDVGREHRKDARWLVMQAAAWCVQGAVGSLRTLNRSVHSRCCGYKRLRWLHGCKAMSWGFWAPRLRGF